MASDERQSLHMLFFPLMSPGHMLPMVDMAKLFADRGVTATIFTTPANVPIIQSLITRTTDNPNYHPIQLLSVPFPSPADTGLPDGCENVASLPSPDMESRFINSLSTLRQQFSRALRDLLPDCVVTDMFLPWTYDAAAELDIPRIVFHGCNFFSLCASAALERHRTLELLPEDSAISFTVPGIPHRIEMLRSQMPNYKNWDPEFIEIFLRIQDSASKSYGVAVNSFYELEPEYARYHWDVIGQKAWHVGPLALTNSNNYEKADRGSKGDDEDSCDCMLWLDSKAPGSVLYVCFGSISYSSEAELRELALGLEASGHPFIWVVRKDVDGWIIPDGFGGRGLIVRGWAPQILILNHPAIGGFLTHCGWNSCLEGITAGVPLVTWPLSADQFYNERFVVDVVKIGVGVGATRYGMDPEERTVVGAGKIESAVNRVMGGGEEAEERRRKAREMAVEAKSAVVEGGSSYVDVGNLMKELMERRQITTE